MEKKEKNLIISLLFAILMLVIINLYILLTVLPAHSHLYKSLGVALPALTITYVSISLFVLKWSILLFLLIFIDFVTYVVLALTIKNRNGLIKIYIVTACALLLFALLSIYAMRLPFRQINKVLSQSEPVSETEKSNTY